MAYMGQLYDSEYIEQAGFTDVRPTFVRADENNKDGREVKEGNYIYKLKYKVPFVPLDEDEEELITNTTNVQAYSPEFKTGKIYNQSENSNYPSEFVVGHSFPTTTNDAYLNDDGTVNDDSDWRYHGYSLLTQTDDEGVTTFSRRYDPDSDDGEYFLTTIKYVRNAYSNVSITITKNDDDDDSVIETIKSYTKYMYTYHIYQNYYDLMPQIDLSNIFLIDGNGLLIYTSSYGTNVYENVNETIDIYKAYSRDKVATINELLPFDGYYSRAFCTDYNATKKYFKVNVTEKSNSVILGNLIADKVTIKKYRDDELKETIEIVPDCYIDKDGILPKVSTTVFGKLDLLAGDVLDVEFFGDKIVVGNIETSYMIDDGLTQYDFSSGYTNYNNRTEEFGEVELGTKPIVGRTSIKNIHNFEDGQVLYLRYKEMQLNNVVYDPFDSFATGLRSSWVIRAFLDSVTIKPLDNKNKFPEKLEIGLSVREIL